MWATITWTDITTTEELTFTTPTPTPTPTSLSPTFSFPLSTSSSPTSTPTTPLSPTFSFLLSPTSSSPIQPPSSPCDPNPVLSALTYSLPAATTFCPSYLIAYPSFPPTNIPLFINSYNALQISNACACIKIPAATSGASTVVAALVGGLGGQVGGQDGPQARQEGGMKMELVAALIAAPLVVLGVGLGLIWWRMRMKNPVGVKEGMREVGE